MMPSTSTFSDENFRHRRDDGLRSLHHDLLHERPTSIQNYKYDVFISFRGADIRNTFVDHLYGHLTRKGIFVFKDDTRLEQGESISPQLVQAINNSRVAIVVFSSHYADSRWCLDEMAAITRCFWDKKQIVFPVFYDVDPSEVRNQNNGVYKDAFLSHSLKHDSDKVDRWRGTMFTLGRLVGWDVRNKSESAEIEKIAQAVIKKLGQAVIKKFVSHSLKHDSDKVDRWRRTMTDLAGLVGWDVRNKSESAEIEKIAQAVIKKLGHKFSEFADDLIGIQPHLEELEKLLKLSSEDGGSPCLGIWGMRGIGKRTLATVLYDRISYQFDACCFIERVSEIYKGGGAIAVQKQILRQTIKEDNLDTYSPIEISGMVRNRLHNIKLLVVLDDVDQFEQLQELHISPNLLHAGSRIIITTIDEHILRQYRAKPIYKAQLMNYDDAYQLLCRKAFRSDTSSSTFAELIPEVLEYAQGLPIAIKSIGSFLYTRSVTEWRATLDGLLKKPPKKRIMEVLQISFEGLEQSEREIFLHVACFFEGEMEDYVWRVLHACGLNPAIEIPRIVEKSLITIRNKEIHMHRMLKEMGKQIARGDHPDEPEFWSRLWLYEDFHRVMTMTEMAAIKAKAIVLDQKEDGFNFNELRAENLSKLQHLKLLILYHKNFSGTSVFLSNSLRYLLWNGYPFDILPSKFQPFYIVELNMPNSSMEQLWSDIQNLPNLKRMDLSNSKNLKETPRFDKMQNLERLDLAGCVNLRRVHPSIGLLSKLKFLSLQNCSSLVCLDFGDRSELRSLKVMCLSGCTKLKNSPDFRGAIDLEYLDMDQCTSLIAIDESIGGRERLKFERLQKPCYNALGMHSRFRSSEMFDFSGLELLQYF